MDVKGKYVNVRCTWCPRAKCWSSNVDDDASSAASSRPANKEGHRDGATPSKQQKLDVPAESKWLTQTELNLQFQYQLLSLAV